MKRILLLICLMATLLASSAWAQAGDARSVINAFIASFAKDNPAWKTDIVAISDPSNVPPGRQLGYSTVVGYYTFLPKTWEQLSDMERQEVYNDPRLKAFLVSLRNSNNYPALTATATPRPAFAVYPVEGLAPTPYYYPVAQPMMPSYPAYPAPGYSTPSYQAPAGYYYTPQQLAPAPALAQPVTMTAPQPAQVSRLVLVPEEMLLNRPLNVYMQNGR